MEYLHVTFRIEGPADDARVVAESLLLEQSVETPIEVARQYDFVRENMLGKIVNVHRVSDIASEATLALPTVTAGGGVAQFLNVLFGNASLHERVSLEDFQVPEGMLESFPGPRFGISGIRERLGVPGRPLTCSALKPVGLSTTQLATLCRTFALGGIDVIKDDHYLGNQPFSPFRERVAACEMAILDVASTTGHRGVYCPNLIGTPDEILRQADEAQEMGVQAVMVAPMLVGLPFFADLVRSRLDVPVFVHPSFAGSTRIRPETLLGRLFRMLGGDAIIFANYGGRFSYSAEASGAIADRCREPWNGIRAAFPVPAGGMSVERTQELVDFFGPDTILLVGGGLLKAGDQLLEQTRAFTSAVAQSANGSPSANVQSE